LGAALTVLAGTLVAWGLTRAADRVQVVSVARPISAGDIIEADDLTTAAVAFDGAVEGLVPAASLDRVVGQVATIDLGAGMLLNTGMWAHDAAVAPDERTVGAVLRAGRFPSGLAHGSAALAIGVPATGVPATGVTATVDGTPVRVLDAEVTPDGALHVTLAVPAALAAGVASLAAIDELVLVGIPAAATVTTIGAGS
jgi:hypothetical protein